MKTVLIFFFLATSLFAQNYIIDDEARKSALKLNDLLINCEFDKAYDLFEKLLKKYPDDPLYYYLALASIGLKTVDFDEIQDSQRFNEIYQKGMQVVDKKLTEEPNNCDLQMIKGFLMSANAAYLLVSQKYIAGVREGSRSLEILNNAHACNPLNYDVQYYLGFYYYAQAELRRRLGPIGIFTGLPRNPEIGLKWLEECVENARFMNRAAEMVLVDVYVRESRLDKTAKMLPPLLKKYPESRFLLWTKMRYNFARRNDSAAIAAAITAAKLYFRDGAYHNGIMILEEARKMSSSRRFPIETRREIAKLEPKINKEKVASSTLRIFNSIIRE